MSQIILSDKLTTIGKGSKLFLVVDNPKWSVITNMIFVWADDEAGVKSQIISNPGHTRTITEVSISSEIVTKYTINDLAKGFVQLKYDKGKDSLDDLCKILKIAFPISNSKIYGTSIFYYKWHYNNHHWSCNSIAKNSLPIITVPQLMAQSSTWPTDPEYQCNF